METPTNLQWKVFFELVFYLCRRGEENLRNLTIAHFKIKSASDNLKYIEKVIDEMDKNHRTNDENEQGGIIQERPNDPNCPVKSFCLYVSKLNPKIEVLFQRPKRFAKENGPWYDASPVGQNTISKFMKQISLNANLSRQYTNHSIRATTITMLDAAGYEARHITSLTGHRSHSSLKSYCRTTVGTKIKMSEILASYSKGENIPSSSRLQNVRQGFDLGVSFMNDEDMNEQDVTPISLQPTSSSSTNMKDRDVASISSQHTLRTLTNSLSTNDIPLLIQNNTNCTFNIKF